MSKEVTVYEGQSIYDVCIQEYGCIEGMELLLKDNPITIDGKIRAVVNGITLMRDLNVGDKLIIRDEVPEYTDTNKLVVRQLKSLEVIVNSGYEPAQVFPGDNSLDFSNPDNSMYLILF